MAFCGFNKMATSSRSYQILSDHKKRVLSTFYENGMTSISKEMNETIQKAANEAGTTLDKVKL